MTSDRQFDKEERWNIREKTKKRKLVVFIKIKQNIFLKRELVIVIKIKT